LRSGGQRQPALDLGQLRFCQARLARIRDTFGELFDQSFLHVIGELLDGFNELGKLLGNALCHGVTIGSSLICFHLRGRKQAAEPCQRDA
jgi:hypothetical protein